MSAIASQLAELLALGLCCPRCHGDLTEQQSDGAGALVCPSCNTTYPVILGIPDLRVFADPYIGIDADRAKGQRLASDGAQRWEELAARYYEITLDTVPPAQARQFEMGLHTAVPRAEAALESWARMEGEAGAASRRVIDVGCGTAPLFAAMGPSSVVKVGVDIAFRWLVVAKLRLENAGVRAHLVCACAEALPFKPATFDVCASLGTLENVSEQSSTIAEAARVLRAGGRLRIATANRTSLGPDPHLGIPAGGMVPDAVAAWWARRRGALPPLRHLLSRGKLEMLLRRAHFGELAFDVPGIPAAQRAKWSAPLRVAGGVYEFARRQSVLRRPLQVIGPSLLATAKKSS
ncbi:MAG: methyltransferase domain-containing protein [bacterium]